MWLRFGTPTASGAASGTEHEFNRAYELWGQAGQPRVMFYFNDAPPERMSDLDIEQYERVREFRSKLETLGLIRSFGSLEQFEKTLRLHLDL